MNERDKNTQKPPVRFGAAPVPDAGEALADAAGPSVVMQSDRQEQSEDES